MILRGLLPATRRSIVAASSLSRHRLQPQPPHLRPLCSTRIPGHDVDLSLTVVNVKALMESSGPLNAVQLTRLLADEEAGKNRVTLVKHIAGKLRARVVAPVVVEDFLPAVTLSTGNDALSTTFIFDGRISGLDDGSESTLGQDGHYEGSILQVIDCEVPYITSWRGEILHPPPPQNVAPGPLRCRLGPDSRPTLEKKEADNCASPQGPLIHWVIDPPHGKGTMVWDNGITYVGTWSHGAFHGAGEKLYSRGGGYSGEWVEGRRQGAGSHIYAGKFGYEQWDGPFVDDQPHGAGEMTYVGGKVGAFEFENGKPVPLKEGREGTNEVFDGPVDDLDDGSPSTKGVAGHYTGAWDADVGKPHGFGETRAGAKRERERERERERTILDPVLHDTRSVVCCACVLY